MKTKVLVWALAVLVLVNLATLGTFLYVRFLRPEGGPPPFRGGPPPEVARMAPAAREKMREIVLDFHRETEPLHRRIRAHEDSIAWLLQLDPPPRERIDGHVLRIADVRAEIGRRAVEHLIGVRGVLTPEQYRFFVSAVLSGPPRTPEGPGPRGNRPFGPPPGPPDAGEGRPPGGADPPR